MSPSEKTGAAVALPNRTFNVIDLWTTTAAAAAFVVAATDRHTDGHLGGRTRTGRQRRGQRHRLDRRDKGIDAGRGALPTGRH